jgi:hypothetical protein
MSGTFLFPAKIPCFIAWIRPFFNFTLFPHSNKSKSGWLNFDEFFAVIKLTEPLLESLEPENCRDENGLIQVRATQELFFGEKITRGLDLDTLKESVSVGATKSQYFSHELYESRIASGMNYLIVHVIIRILYLTRNKSSLSVQRFCAMVVIFHQIGKRVRDFFSKISFGLLYYRMDRTHSIMRIATTASPISGMDVRDRARAIYLRNEIDRAVTTISRAWRSHRNRRQLH